MGNFGDIVCAAIIPTSVKSEVNGNESSKDFFHCESLVALKFYSKSKLRRAKTFQLSYEEKLEKEVEMLQTLRHKNIISVVDFIDDDEEDQLVAVLSPYALYGTILISHDDSSFQNVGIELVYQNQDRIFSFCKHFSPSMFESFTNDINKDHYCLKEQYFLSLVRQMVDALLYLHKRGICHRDIKPSNILIAPAKIYSIKSSHPYDIVNKNDLQGIIDSNKEYSMPYRVILSDFGCAEKFELNDVNYGELVN